jgi:hypothetical protein
MFAMILLCVAVLCSLVARPPMPPLQWVAIGLTVIALLSAALKWAPF